MIDIGRLAIPFKDEFCFKSSLDYSGGLVDLQMCQWNGAKLESGSIEYNSDGSVEVSDLRHPYESVPSSNSSLSFKIFKGGQSYWPFIELKASPAKLLQGHNVFGSCDVEKCLLSLITAFQQAMPDLSDMLDWSQTELKQIDVTFSAQLESRTVGRQVLSALKNISSGQTRPSKNSHATTAYFGVNSNGKKSSRHKQLKIYLKGYELEAQIAEYLKRTKNSNLPILNHQLSIMQSPQVMAFADKALRFEASILPRMLQRLEIPTHLDSFITYAQNFSGCLVQFLWKEAFKDVFSALGDTDMNLYDDEKIHENLKEKFGLLSQKTGKISYAKANRLFRFYRDFKNEGFDEVKRITSESTFYRNLEMLSQVVSKAHLQNLNGIGRNVVPMLRVIDVDFSKQHPVGWQEPNYLHDQPSLRLVS